MIGNHSSPEKVAKYIQIVTNSIGNLAPSLDLGAIEKGIGMAAYGNVSSGTLESDGLYIKLEGSTEQSVLTKVEFVSI